MNLRDFIFSDRPALRLRRHLAFWLVRVALFFLRQCSIFYMKPNGGIEYDFLLNFYPVLVYVGLDVIYCYAVVYWIVPRYLATRKYSAFALLLAMSTVLICLLQAVYNNWLFYGWRLPPSINGMVWHELINNINNGPPVICALFVAIRMLKSWYIKDDERLILEEETISAELQLLKAQVHPHFLFNTLNNIYSFTLSKSPQAAGLVSKLSDTLRYMTTDCDAAMVPLEKELKMINDYIALEKVRYGNRLQLTVDIQGNYHHKMIAPLMIIPFVENSFKHGTSQMLSQPWITLRIIIGQNRLLFSLTNSKPLQQHCSNGKNGIGLKNVQKRLHLLYPQHHRLDIQSTDEVFSVHLELPLMPNENLTASSHQTPAHAFQ